MITKSKDFDGVTKGRGFGQWFIDLIFRFFSLKVAYFFMYMIMPFYYLFGAKQRRGINNYFVKAHGLTKKQARKNTWKVFVNFSKQMLDRFSFFSGRDFGFEFEKDGVELFDKFLAENKGFMLLGSHVGSFELCGYVLKQDKRKIYTMIFGGETKKMSKSRSSIWEKNNIVPVAVSEDLSHLFTINQALEEANIVSMPADRIFGSEKKYTCNFLKTKADFPYGAFSLSILKQAKPLAVFVFREDYKKYKIIVREVSYNQELTNKKEKINSLAESYVHILEEMVQKYPCHWFNFYDYFKY